MAHNKTRRDMKVKLISMHTDVTLERMFTSRPGFNLLQSFDNSDPDLVVFTGGPDINPSVYDEEQIKQVSRISPKRDEFDKVHLSKYRGLPMVGICRGAQFLNLVAGGLLWQHVDNHLSDHQMLDLFTGETLKVTSTHHQMMIPGEDARVLGIAFEAKEFLNDTSVREHEKPGWDTEVVYYPNHNFLCYQPHPEIASADCKDHFFNLLNWQLNRKEMVV